MRMRILTEDLLITKPILLTISHLNTKIFVSVNPTVTDNN